MGNKAAKTTAVVLWLCAVVVLQGAKITTRAESDPKFSFREVKTWAWDPSEPGKVIMARASGDDPAPIKQMVDPMITAAVGHELDQRGWRRATEGAPDIKMHYYLLVTVGMQTQQLGQFLPPTGEWGVPPFSAVTTSLDIIQRGSLVLDAVSTSLDRAVWRGVAQTDVDVARSDAERNSIIRDAVRDLIKRIPFKK